MPVYTTARNSLLGKGPAHSSLVTVSVITSGVGSRQRNMGPPVTSNLVPAISAYVYTLNLKGGAKYVGYTTDLNKRLYQHFSGNGAQWTQKNPPISVNSIQKVSSVAYAKKLETIIYYKMKEYYGRSRVRGAGNTKSY
jgi:putative endonuclease